MDRQPVTTRHLAIIGIVAAALVGCRDDELYDGAFDMPTAAAVLDPSIGGPLAAHEPVGMVTNGIGGRIVLLALKQGRFLTDDDTASFVRTNDLPTGGLRVLTSVAPYAPSSYQVDAFAGDSHFEHLVQVPWIVGAEELQGGRTVPVEGYSSFYPPDETAATAGATLVDVEVKQGYTASEIWTVTFDGADWVVEGSRSGRQPTKAIPGQRFVAEERRIAFTLEGEGNEGDVITVETWNGLVEHDIGGKPLQLLMADDQQDLATIVHDRVDDHPVLRWFDPAEGRVTAQVALPADSKPHRMVWDELDRTLLYVADAGRSAVWAVRQGSLGATEIPMPFPVLDVAPMSGDERNALFVVQDDGRTVWLYDLDTGEFVDQNPLLEGTQGMTFDSPVQGIDALYPTHLQPEYDDDERRSSGRSVAVTLARGSVAFIHEDSGCLVQDSLGPRSSSESTLGETANDYEPNFEDEFGPYLALNGASGRHVLVNPCAGVAQSDSWTLRYDQVIGGWRVYSELRGEQQGVAYEDERYVSDAGEVSFTVRAGPVPSIDGMAFTFIVDAGVAEANGDADGDGEREVTLAVPGDPIGFRYEVGRRDGSWYRVDERALVLVVAGSDDAVGRIDPQEAIVDVVWE